MPFGIGEFLLPEIREMKCGAGFQNSVYRAVADRNLSPLWGDSARRVQHLPPG